MKNSHKKQSRSSNPPEPSPVDVVDTSRIDPKFAPFLSALSPGILSGIDQAEFSIPIATDGDTAAENSQDNRATRRILRAAASRAAAGSTAASKTSTARRRRDQGFLDRLNRRIQLPAGTTRIPRETWIAAGHIMADPTGRAARFYLRSTGNRIASNLIRRAALDLDNPDGHRTWQSLHARRIAAAGLSLMYLGRRTKKPGRYEGIVRGVPRTAISALIRDPSSGHRILPEYMAKRYLRPLEEAGFMYSQQLPAEETAPWEHSGPSGYAVNRYWIVSRDPTRPIDPLEKAALLSVYRAELQARKADIEPENAEITHKAEATAPEPHPRPPP